MEAKAKVALHGAFQSFVRIPFSPYLQAKGIQNVGSSHREYQAAICNWENTPWECYLAFCSLDWRAQKESGERIRLLYLTRDMDAIRDLFVCRSRP